MDSQPATTSFRVRCGGCRTKLAVQSEACGLTIPCPTCGKSLEIPANPPAPAPKKKTSETEAPRPKKSPVFAPAKKPVDAVKQPTVPTPLPAPEPSPAQSQPVVVEPETIKPEVNQHEPVAEAVPEIEIPEQEEVPEIEIPELETVQPEPVEPELPVVQAYAEPVEAPPEDLTPEEDALLNMDLGAVGGKPTRKPSRPKGDAALPKRGKEGRKNSRDDDDAPYWQRQRGLGDDERRSGFRFNSTIIGGLATLVFGGALLAASWKIGHLIIWGPVFILAGFLATIRGLFGD